MQVTDGYITAAINLPYFPGWEYTEEYRPPLAGDYYFDDDDICIAGCDLVVNKIIMQEVDDDE